MYLFADAIVVDESGRVLLIRRDDSRTWAPPGGSLEQNETAAEAVAREVEEETGLKVLPVRLAGVYHLPERNLSRIAFLFRCLRRGGELRPSPEAPQLGFSVPTHLPRPMLRSHRQRIERGLTYERQTPFWTTQRTSPIVHVLRDAYYKYKDIRRRAAGAVFKRPPRWQVEAAVVVQNEAGAVIWQQTEAGPQIPQMRVSAREAPWTTAACTLQEVFGVSGRLTRLIGVYTGPAASATFLFGAALSEKSAPKQAILLEGGAIPANCPPRVKIWLDDALAAPGPTVFRRQEHIAYAD